MKIYYVYKISEINGERFYIGMRGCDHSYRHEKFLDLGIKYFTSSKYVKEIGFHNFMIEILDRDILLPENAFWIEQKYIKENFKISGCLNKQYYEKEDGKKIFYTGGRTLSDDHKKSISNYMKGRPKTSIKQSETVSNRNKNNKIKNIEVYNTSPKMCKHCKSLLSYDERYKTICKDSACKEKQKLDHIKNRKPITEETREKMRDAWKTRQPVSDETRRKQSNASKGKPKTEEHKAAMRKPKSEDAKKNMKGPKSEEHVNNMRRATLLSRILYILDNG